MPKASIFNVEQAVSKFQECFERTINYKAQSKVAVATFLSGGIDSSLVTKEYHNISDNPVNSFTIFYDGKDNKDLKYAEDLVSNNNIVHNKILVKPEDISIDMIDKVIYHMEELLIDKVYISDFINYESANRNGFTVILNGQGSDELWLGYIFTWKLYEFVGEKFNKNELVNDYYLKEMVFKDKIKQSYKQRLRELLYDYTHQNMFKYGSDDDLSAYTTLAIRTILHNLLLQEDKLSMAHSVECRVPFVDDNGMVDLALSIPSKIKTYDGREKYILRESYNDKIPQSILKRMKYPFPEPPDNYNYKIQKVANIINVNSAMKN